MLDVFKQLLKLDLEDLELIDFQILFMTMGILLFYYYVTEAKKDILLKKNN